MGIRLTIFNWLLKQGKDRQLSLEKAGRSFDVMRTRKDISRTNTIIGFLQKPRKDVTIFEDNLDAIYSYRVVPKESTKRVILHLHGGAYIWGLKMQANIFRYFTAELAHQGRATVYAPEYRLAPEHPYPAALEDAYKAYLAILAKGTDPKDLFVSGDSAGAGIALVLMMKLRDQGKPLPRAVLAISPPTDATFSGESIKTNKDRDPVFTPYFFKWVSSVVTNGESPIDPYLSPLYGQFDGLPPMMFIVSSSEMLSDDSVRAVEKAKKAGVEVILDAKEAMMHDYPIFGGIIPDGQAAIKRMGKFIDEHSN